MIERGGGEENKEETLSFSGTYLEKIVLKNKNGFPFKRIQSHI